MLILWSKILLAGLWGGLLAVERKAFLQAMFSRPLVAATGMGLLLDDVRSGLFIGMVLELFHLGAASLGAAISEHDTLAATGVSAAAAGIALGQTGVGTPAIWTVSILLFGGLGPLGRLLDRRLEGYSTSLARRALKLAEAGDLDHAVRLNLWGMWPHFALFGGVTALCALLGFLLSPPFAKLPLWAVRALAWGYPAMASVAAAVAARGSHAKRAALYAGLAAVVVALASTVYLLERP
jgi:mannose/fructose/N-acetylgalactosamine-specific phosphotransferase system component IIC